jgi:C1A family cysteine protease
MVGHGIGVVGYGVTAQNLPYYILKNSWGTDWGMAGVSLDCTRLVVLLFLL